MKIYSGSKVSLILGLAVLVWFTYLQFVHYVIPGLRDILVRNQKDDFPISSIGLVIAPIYAYLLIVGNILLAIKVFGSPAQSLKDSRVFQELIINLKYGLCIGAMWGVIWALSPSGIAGGIILGVTYGLSAALVLGLVLAVRR